MLIVDNILFSPVRGFLWIIREIYNAAWEEMAAEGDSITAELSQLYLMLENGKITEAEFDAREKELLDRLEKINERESKILT